MAEVIEERDGWRIVRASCGGTAWGWRAYWNEGTGSVYDRFAETMNDGETSSRAAPAWVVRRLLELWEERNGKE